MPPRTQQGPWGGVRGVQGGGVGQHRLLRLETHNVRGLRAHLGTLVQHWVQQHVDIALLQEIHMHPFQQSQLEALINTICRTVDPQHSGFKCYWSFNSNPRSAGVAVLVRRQLLHGELQVDESHIQRSHNGRSIAVPIRWGGHSLQLVAVYLPNDSVSQQQFIQQQLLPLTHELSTPALVGGDWNFTEQPILDRLHRRASASAARAAAAAATVQGQAVPATAPASGGPDQGRVGQGPPPAAQQLHSLTPDLQDFFRELHPARRSYTWHSGSAASRLDRWYGSSSLRQHVVQCKVHGVSPSDHRPVLLELLASQSPKVGPGLRRVRLHAFWDDAAAQQEFKDAVAQAATTQPQQPASSQAGGPGAGRGAGLGGEGAGASAELQWARALITWWPTFKSRISHTALVLTHRVRAAHQAATQAAARTQAQAALEEAYTAVEQASDAAQEAAALDQVLTARAAWCAAVAADRSASTWQHRRDWIHQGEQPSRGLTAALSQQRPAASRFTPALRSPSTGGLVTDSRQLAQLVGHHWAQVSSSPPSAPAAAAEVLQAVQAAGLHLPPDDAVALGAAQVSEAEVLTAVKHSKPGKAPGLDGLPVELYRKCSSTMVPLLSNLYTAIGLAGQVPLGFLDGVVVTPPKPGDSTDPNNYRPLTLLNTDYRILAKVLSTRFRAVQHHIVEPEQSGFMPGRHIGDNILLNQLLPMAVGPASSAVVVHVDYYKAYDTVIRAFLFAVLQAFKVGDGFLNWVQLLLSDTGAHALVNGFLSSKFTYTAGVRQGCPLSPQLYLCVAQAMLSFLKQKGFGVKLAATTLTATQFADDAQVFLQSFADVPHFLATMDIFKQASGQGLNVHKTMLHPIGRASRQSLWVHHFLAQLTQQHPHIPPAHFMPLAQSQAIHELQRDRTAVPPDVVVHGLHVVPVVKLLGLRLKTDGTTEVDWHGKLEAVMRVYDFIGRLPLSCFGRGFASASYGISKLLYAAEFAGMPPVDIMAQLETATAKLVDRGLSPSSIVRRFAAVAKELLPGHPRTGGFGAMPWQQHILARHAVWAMRLMLGQDSTPWVRVARSLLAPVDCQCPAWRTLGIAMCADVVHGPTGRILPAALQRLAGGFQALPKWQDVDFFHPLHLGLWCRNAPLWCNPWLTQPQPGRALPVAGLEQVLVHGESFQDLAELSTLTTIHHALTAHTELQQVHSQAQYEQGVWVFWFKRSPALQSLDYARAHLAALVGAIPQAWKDACNAPVSGAGSPHHVLPTPTAVFTRQLWPRLGWPSGVHKGRFVPFTTLSVKEATAMQLAPLLVARAEKYTTFLTLACQGMTVRDVPPTVEELVKLLSLLWLIPWENRRKEFYWRLCLDGIPTAARMHMVGDSCACGVVAPDRGHHYWDCPVAKAVLQELRRNLGGSAIRRLHVWLGRPPVPNLHKQLWVITSQAAMLAMDKGRRVLTAIKLGSDQAPQAAHALPVDVQLLLAGKVAVATFWDMLQDFVGLKLCPLEWLQHVPSQHPFLAVFIAADGSRRLVLHKA